MLKQNSRMFMLIILSLFLCPAPPAFSQSPSPAPAPRKTFTLQIEVTAGDPPEKIERAAVRVTSEKNGTEFKREIKTNKQGVASVSRVPEGKLVIQVVARQYDTFGDEYTLTEDKQTIKISLKKLGMP